MTMQCFGPPFDISGTSGPASADITHGLLTCTANANIAEQTASSANFEMDFSVNPTDRVIQAFVTLNPSFLADTFTTLGLGYANASVSAVLMIDGIFVRPDGTIIPLSSTQTVTLYDAHAALFSSENSGNVTTSVSLMTSITRPAQGPVPHGRLLFPNVFVISVGLQAFAIAGGVAAASASVSTQVNECCGMSQ